MDIKDTFITANSALTDLVLRVRPEHLELEVPAYAHSPRRPDAPHLLEPDGL